MKSKNRTMGTMVKVIALSLIAIVLLTGLAGAYTNPLPVPFKAQVLPGV